MGEREHDTNPEDWAGLDDFNTIPLPDNNGTGSPDNFRLTVRTAIEIEATPDPPDTDKLLGPLVTKGERTIIVGDTGHGKTTFALQILQAVLTGEPMLGHDGAGTGPVMIIDLEQGRRAIKRGLREANLQQRPDVLHISVPDGLALDKDAQHIAELNRVIATHKPTMLLLDPYYKAHRADDPNQERPIIDLMRQLDRLRTDHGFALLLPAHPRKDIAGKEGARKLTLNDISGSGAVTRGAEIILALERLAHGYARLRYLKDREGELPINETVALLYDKQQGFQVDPRDDETDESIEARILDMSTGWLTADEWRKQLGIRKVVAVGVLGQLAASGRIAHMVGPRGRGRSARCYGTSPECWEQSGTAGPLRTETLFPSHGPPLLSGPDTGTTTYNTENEILNGPDDREHPGTPGNSSPTTTSETGPAHPPSLKGRGSGNSPNDQRSRPGNSPNTDQPTRDDDIPF